MLLDTVVLLILGLPVPEAITPQGWEEIVEPLIVGEPPTTLIPA